MWNTYYLKLYEVQFCVLDCILYHVYSFFRVYSLVPKKGSKLEEERAHKKKRTKATVTDI